MLHSTKLNKKIGYGFNYLILLAFFSTILKVCNKVFL